MRICKICGKEFSPRCNAQKYCGGSCKDAGTKATKARYLRKNFSAHHAETSHIPTAASIQDVNRVALAYGTTYGKLPYKLSLLGITYDQALQQMQDAKKRP